MTGDQRIAIKLHAGTASASIGDRVIVESDAVLELHEGGYPRVLYFPLRAVMPGMLAVSDHTTHCPHKGDANYFHVPGPGGVIENAAWIYPTPISDVSAIKDHVAFCVDKVDVRAAD